MSQKTKQSKHECWRIHPGTPNCALQGGMTVRELDDLILGTLAAGPRTAAAIHKLSAGRCTLYDIEAGLRILGRNGLVKELEVGVYAEVSRG